MNDTEFEFLDFAETPIFVLEPDNANRPVYVAFNAYARKILNFSSEKIIGKTANELYPGGLGLIAYTHHYEVLVTGQAKSYELTLPIGGRMRHIRTHLKPVLSDKGQVSQLVGTSHDVTAEHGVREAQANSMVLNSELEEFVNLAAHDLRSPIRHVRSLTHMLREDLPELDESQTRLLDMLEMVAEKAMLLIGDVLSHAETTGSPESIEHFELSALCQDIMQMLDPSDKHFIQIKPSLIFGDKTATQVILRNLIDNALKHNHDRPINLSISSEPAGSNHYLITVSDDGNGFADPSIAFLESKKFTPDSGFGMLGVSRLVKARGGSISANNAKSGKGAIISLVLPGSVQPVTDKLSRSHPLRATSKA